MRNIIFLVLIAFSCTSSEMLAETVVTTYVTTVQKERESTRWTLTEWLRIKERMKMMDVWLAMFSEPKKDIFRPELNLVYGSGAGAITSTGDVALEQTELRSQFMKGQVWLTNFVTASTGLRLLNIDFGIEGYQRSTAEPEFVNIDVGENKFERKNQVQYYAADLRLFGKSIQDSSLVLKFGGYETANKIPFADSTEYPGRFTGRLAGGELQLYLLRSLGAEGNYISYMPSQSVLAEDKFQGSYFDYQGFVEVSLLRIIAGRYSETWRCECAQGSFETVEQGMFAGVKVQI